jgi:amino acid transporter/nucleotide-binding universal stress UspA family protein
VVDETGAVEIHLARDLSFLSATMMGIGATAGAGIFVLLGFAAGEAGPALLLAIILNGLVAGLTAVTYADLGTTFPEAGGGYLWVREALPGPAAFAAGWTAWFGHMVAGAVAALGFGHYVAWGFIANGWIEPASRSLAAMLVGLVVTSAFVAIGYVGVHSKRASLGVTSFVKLATLVALVVFGLVAAFRAPPGNLFPFFELGTGGVLSAMVLTFVAFQGYEVIAQAGEEVRDPEKTIPKAMFLSLSVVVSLYILVAFVALAALTPPLGGSSWGFLNARGETAIIDVGAAVIPLVGGPLLAVGGLVATLLAIDTTVFSASRLSFAMGRDGVLPRALGHVHTKFRAPSTAILLSGLVMLFLVLFSDVKVVATTAGLSFLFAFVLVNASLIRWRYKHPEVRRGFTAPLFPLLPALGIAANLVLVVYLAFDASSGRLAWTIMVLWLSLGLLFYFPYRGRKEVTTTLPGRIDVAQLLARGASPVELEKFRVLVPLREFDNLTLVALAANLAVAHRGELSLLNVLEIPRSLPPKAIRFHYVDERIKGLRKVERYAGQYNVDTRAVVRIGHLPYDIILRTIGEEDVNLLVLGWRGQRPQGEIRILGSTIDYLVQRAPCDVVVAQTKGWKDHVRSVLVYVRSGDQAVGAAELARILAITSQATVTVLEVAETGKPAQPTGDTVAKLLRQSQVEVSVKRMTAKEAAPVVVEESAKHDVLVLGAGERPVLSTSAFGPIVDGIAAGAKCPVLMYRRGTKSSLSG